MIVVTTNVGMTNIGPTNVGRGKENLPHVLYLMRKEFLTCHGRHSGIVEWCGTVPAGVPELCGEGEPRTPLYQYV